MKRLSVNSIAPVPQDRPPLWSVIAVAGLVVISLSPFAFVVAAVLGVLP